jgi:hypothetical protein
VAYSFVQSAEGTRVTSGFTISATYVTQNVGAGNLLVAVIGRGILASGTGVTPTVGQVTDNAGNHWRQAAELIDAAANITQGYLGVDVWYCESAGGGNKPTVTATILHSPQFAITGMNMQVLEYSGNSGRELIDAIGQAWGQTTSLAVTTNGNLSASTDLILTVTTGNQSAATVPSGMTSRLADATQGFWVADIVGGSPGSPQSLTWTALTGATLNAAVIVCFRLTGAQSATGPTLLQSSYTDAAYPSAASLTWTSQNYPVNPAVGNTLVAFVTGIVRGGTIGNAAVGSMPCRAQSITDAAGNTWVPLGESGQDLTSAVNWTGWLCRRAKGGTTALTATFNTVAESAAFLLLEFNGINQPDIVDQTASVASGNTSVSWTASTPANVRAGSLALAILSSLPVTQNHPSTGWTQIMSDTAGVGFAAMQLATAAGGLTITWSGPSIAGTDILLTALRAAPATGAH